MKILVADDDEISMMIIVSLLEKWGYEVIQCTDGKTAWEELCKPNAPALAILDWMMPQMEGVEICKKIRSLSPEPYKYILILTSKARQNDVVAGMDAGADDYICKPFFEHELKARLRAARRIVELQEKFTDSYRLVQQLANHDALTGIYNRRAIEENLVRELDRSAREKRHVGVAMLDIDHFKHINDKFGHLAGDEVLREFSKRLTKHLRMYDVLGRWGGEEFIIIFPDASYDVAKALSERLRETIGKIAFNTSNGLIPVTVSIGVWIGSGVKEMDINFVLKVADVCLYRAKEGGRNKVEIQEG